MRWLRDLTRNRGPYCAISPLRPSLRLFQEVLLISRVGLKSNADQSLKIKWMPVPHLEQDVQDFPLTMHILVISADKRLTRDMQSRLEGAGFTVRLSSSLERSFLEADSVVPSLVLVDDEATPDELWQTKKFLGWFRRCSPVFLISNDGCEALEEDCDQCFPKPDYQKSLMSSIQQLADR